MKQWGRSRRSWGSCRTSATRSRWRPGDQQTKMPPRGGGSRSGVLATLAGISHRQFTDPEIGRLLDGAEREIDGQDPDADDARLLVIVRRRWQKARRVPEELATELARAASTGQKAWVRRPRRRRLRRLRAPPRASGRAPAPLCRVSPRPRRIRMRLRRAARRLRAGDAQLRCGRPVLRARGRAQARAASDRRRAADRRFAAGGPLRGGSPSRVHAGGRGDDGLSGERLADGRHGAPVRDQGRHRRRATHRSLRVRQLADGVVRLDARMRPWALRGRDR